MSINICHISTLHPRNDVRIFYKQCKSLSQVFDVNLIVADGLGDAVVDNIVIHDVGLRQTSRLKRAKIDSEKAFKKAMELDCNVYHFHDPELTRIGAKLKNAGKTVIYDVHEDLPRQIMSKPYINKFIRPFISMFAEWQEDKAARKFDHICTATPFIRDRFLKVNKKTVDINNYPIIGELQVKDSKKDNSFCYTGGITEERGIINIIESLNGIDTELTLAGTVHEKDYLEGLKKSDQWPKVDYRGLVNRDELSNIMSKSIAGIVTFLPIPNHVNSQPNKIFEYMSAGIPVVGSNFDLWKEIIEDNKCGICINPDEPKKISEALETLINNPELAKEMGDNGLRVVQEKYNWKVEEKKLFSVYETVLNL